MSDDAQLILNELLALLRDTSLSDKALRVELEEYLWGRWPPELGAFPNG